MRLGRAALLDLVVRAIRESEWQSLVVDSGKPFRIRCFRAEDRGPDVCIYIWNCTHGGGLARAANEYRIQFTGVVPREQQGQITLLLGWHSGYGVFAAWDIRFHDGQDSASPSAQIREELLSSAHVSRFSVGQRANGEIVVAFRPEFLMDYAINADRIHRGGAVDDDLASLNEIECVDSSAVDAIVDAGRRQMVATMVRRYRASDFRRRVLGAYNRKCAMCDVQLELIDAAHILPVAIDGSTDATSNGIALCKLHHAAYDRNLVSFDEEYRIEVSDSELSRLGGLQCAGGLDEFRASLRNAIVLPNDRRDYPLPALINLSRQVRGWSNN